MAETAEVVEVEGEGPRQDPDKQYLLERGWLHWPDGKWYDSKPPAPHQVVIARVKQSNGSMQEIKQWCGPPAPWAYSTIGEALHLERGRNRGPIVD